MSRVPDFLDAHERHFKDGKLLLDMSRIANADHLFGLAAECGLKCLMMSFGMKLNNKNMPEEKADREHANRIWDRYSTYQGGAGSSHYSLGRDNPFADWDISHRYDHRDGIRQADVEKHYRGAVLVNGLIKNAQRDNILIKNAQRDNII